MADQTPNPMETAAGILNVLDQSWEECETLLTAAGFTKEDWCRWQYWKAVSES